MPPRRNRPRAGNRATQTVAAPDTATVEMFADEPTTEMPEFSERMEVELTDIVVTGLPHDVPDAFVRQIRQFGVLTPVTLRALPRTSPRERQRYDLLHGRRRLRAFAQAFPNRTRIPARVVTNYNALPRTVAASLTVSENVHHAPSIEALARALTEARGGFATTAECARAFGMTAREVQAHLLMSELAQQPWWAALREGRTDADVLRRIATGVYQGSVVDAIRRDLGAGRSVTARQATALATAMRAPTPRAEQVSLGEFIMPQVERVSPDPNMVRIAHGDTVHLRFRPTANARAFEMELYYPHPEARREWVRGLGGLSLDVAPGTAESATVYLNQRPEAATLATAFASLSHVLAVDGSTPPAPAAPARRAPRRRTPARAFDAAALDTCLRAGTLDDWQHILAALVCVRDAHPVEPDNDHDAFGVHLDALCERAERILSERAGTPPPSPTPPSTPHDEPEADDAAAEDPTVTPAEPHARPRRTRPASTPAVAWDPRRQNIMRGRLEGRRVDSASERLETIREVVDEIISDGTSLGMLNTQPTARRAVRDEVVRYLRNETRVPDERYLGTFTHPTLAAHLARQLSALDLAPFFVRLRDDHRRAARMTPTPTRTTPADAVERTFERESIVRDAPPVGLPSATGTVNELVNRTIDFIRHAQRRLQQSAMPRESRTRLARAVVRYATNVSAYAIVTPGHMTHNSAEVRAVDNVALTDVLARWLNSDALHVWRLALPRPQNEEYMQTATHDDGVSAALTSADTQAQTNHVEHELRRELRTNIPPVRDFNPALRRIGELASAYASRCTLNATQRELMGRAFAEHLRETDDADVLMNRMGNAANVRLSGDMRTRLREIIMDPQMGRWHDALTFYGRHGGARAYPDSRVPAVLAGANPAPDAMSRVTFMGTPAERYGGVPNPPIAFDVTMADAARSMEGMRASMERALREQLPRPTTDSDA